MATEPDTLRAIQVPGGHFMHREHPDHVVSELVRVVREHAPAAAE